MNDSKLINKNMGRPGMRNMNCQRMYGMNSDVNNLYELGFVLTESILYLDTHPDDTEAIEYYSQMRDELLKHMDYYAKNFGPLNYFNIESQNYWTWVSTPMPWELQ